MDSITEKAIEKAGGAAALARELGVTVQAICKWTAIPPRRVLDVERVTGISRHKLRPDIFGQHQ